MLSWVAILAALLVQVLLFSLPFVTSNQFSGFSITNNSSELIKATIGGLSSLLGILCGELYKELDKSKTKEINIIQTIQQFTKSPRFYLSIIVSPIAFLFIYNTIKQLPDNLGAFLFAFENGFFFHVIMPKKRQRQSGKT